MWLAYVDESGDPGALGSLTYTLGCVLVESQVWYEKYQDLMTFRRHLRQYFGIRMRDEIKASYLVRGSGSLASLKFSETARRDIYRQHMRLISKMGLTYLAVVIEKSEVSEGVDTARRAWELLLGRLYALSVNRKNKIMIVHDEGDDVKIRSIVHEMRSGFLWGIDPRFDPSGLSAGILVEDPVSKRSDQSYFIQLSDLVAYAAFRKNHPPQKRGFHVCTHKMWSELSFVTRKRFLRCDSRELKSELGIFTWPDHEDKK